MSQHQQITMSTFPLHLGDKVFNASPLSDKDLAEMDSWVQAKTIRIARESLPSNASPAEREETLTIALRLAQTLTAWSGTGAKMIASVEGMTRLVWQSCKRNHPELTEDCLREYMFDPDNIRETQRVFKKLNNPDSMIEPGASAGKKGGADVQPIRPMPPQKRKSTKR